MASSPGTVPFPALPSSLPNLHGLRVFEAAARHMSFTRAARELCITQTAVSHQVKALEEELGAALFRRTARQVSLTPLGAAWAAELGPLFAQLHRIHRKLRGPAQSRDEVAVSLIPSFGTRWLIPRLGRFLGAHPHVELKISASAALATFDGDGVDIGIRYGGGRYPGLAVEKLADDAWVVVAAPSLLQTLRLRAPRDLGGQLLIHDDSPGAWDNWFEKNGVEKNGRGSKRAARTTEIEDSSMLVEAALRGQGIALARRSLVVDDITAGRLALVFPRIAPVPTGLAYYLAAPRENLRRPPVAAFWNWVRQEAVTLRQNGKGEDGR